MKELNNIRLLLTEPLLKEDATDAADATIKAITCALSVIEEACLTIASELRGMRDGCRRCREEAPEEVIGVAIEKLACAQKVIRSLVKGALFHVER